MGVRAAARDSLVCFFLNYPVCVAQIDPDWRHLLENYSSGKYQQNSTSCGSNNVSSASIIGMSSECALMVLFCSFSDSLSVN